MSDDKDRCPVCGGRGFVTISHEATKHDGGWIKFDEWTERCEACDGTGRATDDEG